MEIEQVKQDIENAFNVYLGDRKRDDYNVQCRLLFSLIAHRYCNTSVFKIGKHIERTHATVLHHLKNEHLLMDRFRSFYNEYTNTKTYEVKKTLTVFKTYLPEDLTIEKAICIDAIKGMNDSDVNHFFNYKIKPYLKQKQNEQTPI